MDWCKVKANRPGNGGMIDVMMVVPYSFRCLEAMKRLVIMYSSAK